MSELHALMRTGSEMETSHGGSPCSKKTSFRFRVVTVAGASISSVENIITPKQIKITRIRNRYCYVTLAHNVIFRYLQSRLLVWLGRINYIAKQRLCMLMYFSLFPVVQHERKGVYVYLPSPIIHRI